MKRYWLIFVCCLVLGTLRAQDNATRWNSAVQSYSAGQFDEAIQNYEAILQSGVESPELYYNLGNAHFKAGHIGAAVLNLSRAKLLDPTDEDIDYNLKFVSQRVQDQIESLPEFFVKTWMRSWRQSLSSNGWAAISLVAMVLLAGCILLFLLARRMLYRKTGFYAGIVMVIVLVLSVTFAAINRHEKLSPSQGVVMSSAAPIKASPDAGSQDIFVLHEGTVVGIQRSLNGWYEVKIANGNKGWVQSNAIELIN